MVICCIHGHCIASAHAGDRVCAKGPDSKQALQGRAQQSARRTSNAKSIKNMCSACVQSSHLAIVHALHCGIHIAVDVPGVVKQVRELVPRRLICQRNSNVLSAMQSRKPELGAVSESASAQHSISCSSCVISRQAWPPGDRHSRFAVRCVAGG